MQVNFLILVPTSMTGICPNGVARQQPKEKQTMTNKAAENYLSSQLDKEIKQGIKVMANNKEWAKALNEIDRLRKEAERLYRAIEDAPCDTLCASNRLREPRQECDCWRQEALKGGT